LHDPATIGDVQTYEDVGLRPYGEGHRFESAIAITPIQNRNPKLPSIFRRLLGCMHSVGAAGIMQAFGSARSQNRWAEFHGDEKRWKEFGRENRRIGGICR
jgi:acetyl-CoA C-acetyltransferase